MNRMSISAATIALALFGLMSVGWAGEMKAKMEEMKGDTKAKVEEMKGEAKAAVEEAKGNKVQAEVERAKGKGKDAIHGVWPQLLSRSRLRCASRPRLSIWIGADVTAAGSAAGCTG